jgi:hypothetical protein
VNWSAGVARLVPSGVVTVMSTVPSSPVGGLTVVISVSEFTVKSTGSEPNSTSVALVKSDPEIVTSLPPLSVPTLGLTLVTVGTAAARAAWPATACSASMLGTIAMTATMTRNCSFSLRAPPGLGLCSLLEFSLANLSATDRPKSTCPPCSFAPAACYRGRRSYRGRASAEEW